MNEHSPAKPSFRDAPWQKPPIELSLPHRLVHPSSWVGHLPFAFWIIGALEPKKLVELGVHTGNSYSSFCQAIDSLDLNTQCFGVDHWFGDPQAGFYGDEIYESLKRHHDPRYGQFSTLLRMSFEDAVSRFDDGTVDLLHIDGFHTYDAVSKDLALWRRKLSDRSIVLFHDTAVYDREFGVWQLLEQLQSEHPTFNFLHSNGLGVVYFGTQSLPPHLEAFFAAAQSEDQTSAVRNYFSGLGDRLVARLGRAEAVDRVGLLSQQTVSRAFQPPPASPQVKEEIEPVTGETSPQESAHSATKFNHATSADSQQLSPPSLVERLRNRASGLKRHVLGSSYSVPGVGDDQTFGVKKVGRAALLASGLFDEEFYRLTTTDVAENQDALSHYEEIGERSGARPSPNFDPNYYARRYPDVGTSGMGLLEHYVLYGREEGRHSLPPAERMKFSSIIQKGDKDRLLIVLPDLNGEGYGLAALALLTGMKDQQIYILALAEGPLRSILETRVQAVFVSDILPCPEWEADEFAQSVIAIVQPTCTVFFGVAGYKILAGFGARGAANLAILEEADRYLQDDWALSVLGAWSGAIVFHSQITATRAEQTYPDLRTLEHHLITPGALGFPPLPPPLADTVCDAVRSWLRPDSTKAYLIVAVDGSAISSDVISAIATEVAATHWECEVRLAWVGSAAPDYDPEINEAFTSLAVVPQDMRPYWQIVAQLSDVYLALNNAPQVQRRAQELIVSGQQVILPQSLESILGGEDAGQQFFKDQDWQALVDSIGAAEPRQPSAGLRLHQIKTFAVDDYVRSIEGLASNVVHRHQRLEQAYDTIQRSGLFDHEFYNGVELDLPLEAAIRHHCVAVSRTDLDQYRPHHLRRPFPGFNPLVYAQSVLRTGVAAPEFPLAHYLDQGRPEGPWHHSLIAPGSDLDREHNLRVAVHGHFFYPELFGDFLERFGPEPGRYDFFITVSDLQSQAVIYEQAKYSKLDKLEVIVCENVGRDVAPFVEVLGNISKANYDVVGHFHGKKSAHLMSSDADRWREFLFEHLIGKSYPMADTIVSRFAEQNNLGLVFPEDPVIFGWGDNKPLAYELAKRAGIRAEFPDYFEFPVGNMFWARPRALDGLLRMKLMARDYPKEPLGVDGTMLHTIERLLPFLVQEEGYTISSSHVPGVLR